MECMEARALKSSFSSEIAMKTNNPQSIFDDFWCVAGLPSDDFSIDEFFDLPNEENIDGSSVLEEEDEKDSSSFSLSSSHDPVDDSNDNSTNFSPDLAIPVDDVQELELWSHLMDDSIPEPILACPNPILDAQKTKTGFNFMNRVEPVNKPVFYRISCIPNPSAVPVKPRSKRSRSTGNRSWVFNSPPKTDSSSTSSPTSSPVSTLFFPPPVQDMGVLFNFGKPPMKKPKKKPAVNSSAGENPPVQRRCSHCQVTKTPQWRAGPNGPKTLCNACGVRFKSGRLFPEYRPACSPTFSSEVHSNSHRKVLEMRKKKETTESITGLAQTILSS
ncbi:GATA transcription factor 5-like [Chenopodium quinoa]|uniref:GATA transcription factor 5-like n=1 Tax=Chenopodium quinoa TaxID=63459 RepID=UPI000B790A02|nr:GATA transcription factor 5-like [Chenopodium quinoa]